MGIKIIFKPKAMEDMATELRRASWGLAVTAGAGGVAFDNVWVPMAGGAAWVILQITAVALGSIQDERGAK